MQLIDSLIKPYTSNDREQFVIRYMYGYELKETGNALEVWSDTPEEIREREFNNEFFQTSLGYIRRKFTNKNGETKDFLSDAFPSLLLAFKEGIIGEIFVYDKPPFDEDISDMTPYQHKVSITQQFIQECFNQTSVDFFG